MANKYTDEYRREAVDYVLSSGKSIKECAGELGLNDKTLSHWVSKFKKEGRTGSGMTADEKELAAAQKRIRELEMENAFLKKAAAFFAKSQA
jgi:transposase